MPKFFGILTRKERWGLSIRGWIVLASISLALVYLMLLGSYPFLAVTRPVDARILVTEGWVHEGAIRTSVEEFHRGNYDFVFTTGGLATGSGAQTSDANTSANVIADWLQYRGIPKGRLHAVPCHVIGRDRTYHSAVALRDWLREHNIPVQSLNVVTETAHARRTRYLYRKAFGDSVAIGIIAAANPDYDPNHWWRYSDGVRDVVSEGVAYIYARMFFHPSRSGI